MKFTSLFSSSSGNCIYVENKDTRVLIDAGFSGKAIQSELKKIDVYPEQIDAILLTHEHSDHISSAGILSRRCDIPIYSGRNTLLVGEGRLGKVSEKNKRIIERDTPFSIKDIEFTPFKLPHDAAEPLGFMFDDGINKGALSTDMGIVTEKIEEYLHKCTFVFLEANHDIDMLKTGPYPYVLKKRILSPYGHLSNKDAGELCARLVKAGAKYITLGHLSRQNNTYQIARRTVEQESIRNEIEEGKDFILKTATRDGIDPIIEF